MSNSLHESTLLLHLDPPDHPVTCSFNTTGWQRCRRAEKKKSTAAVVLHSEIITWTTKDSKICDRNRMNAGWVPVDAHSSICYRHSRVTHYNR